MTLALEHNFAPPAQSIDRGPARDEHLRRIEELGRVILAYSEVTERLEQSHQQLTRRLSQLQDELGEKNRQLERRNRLEALGEMAAGIAHEIRNPLGAIRLYASLLKSDVSDRPDAAATVGKVCTAIDRLEMIVSQVLHFTREIRANRCEVNVSRIVHDSIELARARVSSNVNFEAHGPASLAIQADPILLGQALLNLLLNAGQAIGETGAVEVKFHRSRGRGKTLRLIIEDDGPGIPPQVMNRLFHPFVTTKDDGTGLGLAIAHRIVEAHDGTITATQRQPRGARFEIVI